jgi:hypothetical protein
MVCQLCEDRWLQAGFELAPNVASAAPPQVRSASPRHRACDPHASLGRETQSGSYRWFRRAPSTVADLAQMETAAKRTPSSCRCTGSDPQARTPARRTGLCLIRLDKPAFPSQTAPREQLARGQPVSPRRRRHKPGPTIAPRHDPVLLFQRPTAPGARRDNVKPRGLRNRRMPSNTPISSPRQHIRQGGLRRKNMSKSDICAIKWSPFRGAPKRRIARS